MTMLGRWRPRCWVLFHAGGRAFRLKFKQSSSFYSPFSIYSIVQRRLQLMSDTHPSNPSFLASSILLLSIAASTLFPVAEVV